MSFQSTKSGNGSPSPSRAASSRSPVLPASGRVQVPAVGARAGYQNSGRRPSAVRIPDKQRPLTSQENSRTPSCVRPASAPRACSNAPRGHRGEHPRKSTVPGPMASHGGSRPTGARSEPSATNLSGLSATTHLRSPKTVGRDVKVPASQGARVSKKPVVEAPSRQPANVTMTGVGTSRPSNNVPSRQTPHAVPAGPASMTCRQHTPRLPTQKMTVATPSGLVLQVKEPRPRLQGLSSSPSVRVAGIWQPVVPLPQHVPRPMARVSSSCMGHHFEQSRLSCRVAATGYPATTGHSRVNSRSRCPVVR